MKTIVRTRQGILAVGASVFLTVPAWAANWPTYAGSANRLGYNGLETTLTPSTVPGLQVRWSRNLHDESETQPLYIENVAISGHNTQNEVYQTTLKGQVFAINAANGHVDWTVQLPTASPSCAPTFSDGVHGTPTIDPVAGLLYVVDNKGLLHALSIANGTEAAPYPVRVITAAQMTAAAYNHSSPTLVGSMLYVTTSVTGACEQYHPRFKGSVIGFDTATQSVAGTFNPLPNADGAGIWGPGGAALDPDSGNLLIATGNAYTAPTYRALAESVVALDPNLNLLASDSPGPPILTNGGDLDFGSTPTPIDAQGCAPMLSVMNKTGWLYVYDRNNLSAGPSQLIGVSKGGGGSSFWGMAAYDPTLQMLFINNPVAGPGGYSVGAVALIVTSQCTLAQAWQTSGIPSGNSQSTDPTIAGGVVWMVTGLGHSLLAFSEVGGNVLFNSGDAMQGKTYNPATVADGQVYVQSGDDLFAWGL
jgi:outer membrane protein assembly factor BamB